MNGTASGLELNIFYESYKLNEINNEKILFENRARSASDEKLNIFAKNII